MVEENKIKNLLSLSLIALFLAAGIGLIPTLPSLISYQDPIDPNALQSTYDPAAKLAIFNNQFLSLPHESTSILGDSISLPSSSSKQIHVDLTTQILTAFEDGQKKFEYKISSGTWNRTPNGTFTIWAKVRSQKMSGGSKELGTYYYLPNVPHVLFFYNDKTPKKVGYSIHGAYWHNNFGVPMSHGCINMRTTEVGSIYNWAEVGTTITINGKYQSRLAQK